MILDSSNGIQGKIKTDLEKERVVFPEETTIIANEPKKPVSCMVVYSFDSISSIMAAGLLLGIVETHTNTSGQKLDVKFVEVGALNIQKMPDEFIWLGVEPAEQCSDASIRTKFNRHEHIVINDDSLWQFPNTKFVQQLATFAQSNLLQIKTVTSNDQIAFSREPESALYYGMLLSAINALTKIYPDTSFDSLASEIGVISGFQKRCAQFYDRQAPIHRVLETYMIVNNLLVDLGQPGIRIPTDISIEALSEHYKARYDLTAKQITNQATTRYVQLTKQVFKDRAPYKGNTGVTVPVICTFLSQDFWLARRIINFSQKYYHNTRLVSYGKHQTTNLLQTSVADMAGQSDNAIIINKS